MDSIHDARSVTTTHLEGSTGSKKVLSRSVTAANLHCNHAPHRLTRYRTYVIYNYGKYTVL
jgi:hypothetical protein